MSRSISIRKTMRNIAIHRFSDANVNGVYIVAYAVMYRSSNISQVLIASKSKLAKRNLTIPRLELIVVQMSAYLAQNIKKSLNNQRVRNCCPWPDSAGILSWWKDKGEYKVLVSNLVAKIREHNYLA